MHVFTSEREPHTPQSRPDAVCGQCACKVRLARDHSAIMGDRTPPRAVAAAASFGRDVAMKSLAGNLEDGPTVAEAVGGSPRSVCAPLALCMHDGSVEQVALCEPSASVRKSVGRFVTLRRGPAGEAAAGAPKYFCDAWAATVEDKLHSGPSATGYVRLIVFDGRVRQMFGDHDLHLYFLLANLRRSGEFGLVVNRELIGLSEQWVPCSELVEPCVDESVSSEEVARLFPSETGLHGSSPSKGMSSQWWRDAGVPLRFGVGDLVKYFCDQQQCFIPARVQGAAREAEEEQDPQGIGSDLARHRPRQLGSIGGGRHIFASDVDAG
jgi:hypothetical protein